MSSSCPSLARAAALAAALLTAGAAVAEPLRVCADPANLPYSDQRQAGFENRIAGVLARDLGRDVAYTWATQGRGFLRHTLAAGRCDVVISVPRALGMVLTTRPYFTSAYVFVTRRGLHIASFDDPRLPSLRIGLQLVGAEGANTPPSLSLARRGITAHVTGYPMWDSADVADPQGRIVAAVAHGDIDVAIVWGPFAGYFARPFGAALALAPITADPLLPALRFAYPMAVGVRRGDQALRAQLQQALDRRAAEIRAILAGYAVPILTLPAPQEDAHAP